MTLPWTDAFRGRRVLITGHTGFKGSWLTLWLHRLGAQVTGYALPPPTPVNNFELSQVRELLAAHHEGDVRDPARLREVVARTEPEVVFHLAAQPIVRTSYEGPVDTFATNVMGTVHLLEAVRAAGRPCIVVSITSDKCYEVTEQVWGYRECDPMGGHDPYSASKGAAELVVSAYRRSYFPPRALQDHGVKLASARAGNVIGGGDWAPYRLVPDLVRALQQRQPVEVRFPRAVRPWQHVLEPLSGYLTLAARLLESDQPRWCTGWNFGPQPGDDLPVAELIDRFFAAWGAGEWVDASDPDVPHEAAVLRLSIDKAVAELGWRPAWDVAQSVARAAGWFRRWLDGAAMREVCLEDIAAYEDARERP